MADVNATVTRKGDTDDYTLQDLGWDRVPRWMEGKPLSEMISLKGKTALVTGAGGMAVFFSFTSFLYSIFFDYSVFRFHKSPPPFLSIIA